MFTIKIIEGNNYEEEGVSGLRCIAQQSESFHLDKLYPFFYPWNETEEENMQICQTCSFYASYIIIFCTRIH